MTRELGPQTARAVAQIAATLLTSNVRNEQTIAAAVADAVRILKEVDKYVLPEFRHDDAEDGA